VRDLTRQLAHANGVIRAMQDQTELRMRELHHRMKNYLQVVSSLLDWHGQDLEGPGARTIFEACRGRVRAMALIHELLSRAGDQERTELGPYLRRLAFLVFEAYGVDREPVRLEVQCDPITVKVRTGMACGLLVHELLSNGAQHAFPRRPRGRHDYAAGRTGGAGDPDRPRHGVGLPPDLKGLNGESFGLHLVRALTEQLRGAIAFTRERGTCVTLTFRVCREHAGEGA
jgi:two-component sensor histidine kinase